MHEIRYCELCGSIIRGAGRRITVEGVAMTVCARCYTKLADRQRAREMQQKTHLARLRPINRPVRQQSPRRRRSTALYDQYEIVEDYAERIRNARVRLGWSQAVLARRVGEKENVIKRIESGRLTPPLDLARRLERVLRIKLLEPVVEEPFKYKPSMGETTLTLGDVVKIRGEDEK